jgi:hypothetical protein
MSTHGEKKYIYATYRDIMKLVEKVCRESRIQDGRHEALISIEHSRSPFPYAAVVPPPPVFYARRCTVDVRRVSDCMAHSSGHRRYLRHRMPVTKPDVSSSFIAALEFIEKEPEFGLGRKASATNDRISGKTVVVGNDGPVVGNLHRNRSIKSADLDISQQLTKTYIYVYRNNLREPRHFGPPTTSAWSPSPRPFSRIRRIGRWR